MSPSLLAGESEYDVRRDAFLRAEGFSLLRFWNHDVLHRAFAVVEAIYANLISPHPRKPEAWVPPSPAMGEGLIGSTEFNG